MCEDYPCCGHDVCPDYRNGKQINMKCVCGATVPLTSRSSLCETCLSSFNPEYDFGDEHEMRDSEY